MEKALASSGVVQRVLTKILFKRKGCSEEERLRIQKILVHLSLEEMLSQSGVDDIIGCGQSH